MSHGNAVRTPVGHTAVHYLQKYKRYPLRTIARLMCEAEPKLFKDMEAARTVLRYYAGQHGKDSRDKAQEPELLRDTGHQSDSLERLPAPAKEFNPWRVERIDFKRALVISDVHIPFHDAEALKVALRHGMDRSVDTVIILGDFMDFHACSHFERDPRLRDLPAEVQVGREALSVIRDNFKKAQIVYLEGNHEARWWRYIWARCPEIFGMTDGSGADVTSLGGIMACQNYGIQVVDGMKPLVCGDSKLYLLHGHEYKEGFMSPVNPARGMYLRSKVNCACGHYHRTSNHSEAGLDKIVSVWSIGCLCGLRPSYRPLNTWNHGLAVVELDGTSWQFDNLKIIGGRVV